MTKREATETETGFERRAAEMSGSLSKGTVSKPMSSSTSSNPSATRAPDTLRFRWAVDVAAWEPSAEEFTWATSTLILDSEKAQVMKYRFEEDRKRALVSLMLQRTAGARYLSWRRGLTDGAYGNATGGANTQRNANIDDIDDISGCIRALEDVRLGKTKGRKPYLVKAGGEPSTRADPTGGSSGGSMARIDWNDTPDNFNYNVSHDGNYVVLASETYCVCGCDVSSAGSLLGKRRGSRAEDGLEASMDTLRKTLKSFEAQLTAKEWDAVYGEVGNVSGEAGGRAQVFAVASRFAKYWSLKEAYVKAIGMGLGYDLGRVEFEVVELGDRGDGAGSAGVSGVAFVSIDGELNSDWCCYLHTLGNRGDKDIGCDHGGAHWVSVARGPVQDVIDAHGGFTESFGVRDMTREMLNKVVFQDKEPAFEELGFGDLIKMGYGEAVHRTWATILAKGRE